MLVRIFASLSLHLEPQFAVLFVENMKMPLQLKGRTSMVMLELQSSTFPDSHSKPIELGVLIEYLLME